MFFTLHCDSPLGGILLAADEIGLTGLWFDGAKYFAAGLPCRSMWKKNRPRWPRPRAGWTQYFSGREPDFLPPLHPHGTAFQRAVWDILRSIPYGQTMTYGEIARRLAAQQGAFPHVRPGRRRRGGPQSHLADRPLPPRGGRERQPDGLCRRRRAQVSGCCK